MTLPPVLAERLRKNAKSLTLVTFLTSNPDTDGIFG